MEVESHVPSLSEAALKRSADTAMAGALAAGFNEDPVIGAALSRANSVLCSLKNRHGLLLQKTLAEGLAASGRFDVLVDVTLPITDAAQELLRAHNSAEDLAKINIRADASAERMTTIDLIVIDPEVAWAGAYEVKRGNGSVDGRTRRPIENDLRAARLILASYLAKRGYPDISTVTTGVIDYYGGTGFRKELKLGCDDLDDHFGVPIRATLDQVTACLRSALHAELPHLFATVLESIQRDAAKTRNTEPRSDRAIGAAVPEATVDIINARPTGPGPRKSTVAVQMTGMA
jgi:hypothetical protein